MNPLKNKLKKKSILLIGPYPEPYGGVSIHIKRLYDKLSSNNFNVTVYCQKNNSLSLPKHIKPTKYNKFNWILFFFEHLFNLKYDIIHCHDGLRWAPGLLILNKLNKRIIVTIHDQMVLDKWKKLRFYEKICSMILFKQKNIQFIAVSKTVKDILIQLGIKKDDIIVIPAFIIPSELINFILPEQITYFAKYRKPLLTIYGVNFAFDKNNIDLYGFDITIEMINKLKVHFNNIGLFIIVPDNNNINYFNKLKKRIDLLNLHKNIFIWDKPIENLNKLWEITDIYLRPTTTDGDAVAIRESLYFNTPVVASDAAYRPFMTCIFSSRNIENYYEQVLFSLNNLDLLKNKIKNMNKINNTDLILSYYRDIIEI